MFKVRESIGTTAVLEKSGKSGSHGTINVTVGSECLLLTDLIEAMSQAFKVDVTEITTLRQVAGFTNSQKIDDATDLLVKNGTGKNFFESLTGNKLIIRYNPPEPAAKRPALDPASTGLPSGKQIKNKIHKVNITSQFFPIAAATQSKEELSFKVNEIPDITLYDRNSYLKAYSKVVKNNFDKKGNPDHTLHQFFFCPGACGTGKTTIAKKGLYLDRYKLLEQTDKNYDMKNAVYLYFKFESNPDELVSYNVVGIKIAREVFGVSYKEYDKWPLIKTLKIICAKWRKKKSISKDTWLPIIIHIDEFQEFFPAYIEKRSSTYSNAIKAFENVIREVGSIMSSKSDLNEVDDKCFIVPVITGTSFTGSFGLKSSTYIRIHVQLCPLFAGHAIPFFCDWLRNRIKEKPTTRDSISIITAGWYNPKFQWALRDTGYYPRIMNNLLDAWADNNFSTNRLCGLFKERVNQWAFKSWKVGNKLILRNIIYLGVTGEKVDVNAIIEGKTQLCDVINDGRVIYEMGNSLSWTGLGVVKIPFIHLLLYLGMINDVSLRPFDLDSLENDGISKYELEGFIRDLLHTKLCAKKYISSLASKYDNKWSIKELFVDGKTDGESFEGCVFSLDDDPIKANLTDLPFYTTNFVKGLSVDQRYIPLSIEDSKIFKQASESSGNPMYIIFDKPVHNYFEQNKNAVYSLPQNTMLFDLIVTLKDAERKHPWIVLIQIKSKELAKDESVMIKDSALKFSIVDWYNAAKRFTELWIDDSEKRGLLTEDQKKALHQRVKYVFFTTKRVPSVSTTNLKDLLVLCKDNARTFLGETFADHILFTTSKEQFGEQDFTPLKRSGVLDKFFPVSFENPMFFSTSKFHSFIFSHSFLLLLIL